MKLQIKDIMLPFFITIFLLIILEVISTALLPVIGITDYRLTFYVLIILFMGFKLETPYLSVLILGLSYVHSFFSIEGWAMGTLAGVLVCSIISYLRELIHFSSIGLTIFVTQIFQLVWFVIVSFMLYLQGAEWPYFVAKMWRFIPESFTLSLISPFAFFVLDRIWRNVGERMLGDSA